MKFEEELLPLFHGYIAHSGSVKDEFRPSACNKTVNNSHMGKLSAFLKAGSMCSRLERKKKYSMTTGIVTERLDFFHSFQWFACFTHEGRGHMLVQLHVENMDGKLAYQ